MPSSRRATFPIFQANSRFWFKLHFRTRMVCTNKVEKLQVGSYSIYFFRTFRRYTIIVGHKVQVLCIIFKQSQYLYIVAYNESSIFPGNVFSVVPADAVISVPSRVSHTYRLIQKEAEYERKTTPISAHFHSERGP